MAWEGRDMSDPRDAVKAYAEQVKRQTRPSNLRPIGSYAEDDPATHTALAAKD